LFTATNKNFDKPRLGLMRGEGQQSNEGSRISKEDLR
jgi:hypothetical protein